MIREHYQPRILILKYQPPCLSLSLSRCIDMTFYVKILAIESPSRNFVYNIKKERILNFPKFYYYPSKVSPPERSFDDS